MGLDKRKYLMAQINASQYQTAFLKEELANLDEGGGATTEEVADTPANGGAAKVLAAKKAAAARAAAAAKAKADAEVDDDALEVEEEAAEEVEAEEETVEEDDGAPTEDDVKAAVKKLAAKCGKTFVASLLKKFNAKAIQGIKAKDYAQAITLCEATIKKAKK